MVLAVVFFGYHGAAIGARIYRPHDIIGKPLSKQLKFNYESHGSAIGAALGTVYGNQ